MKFKLNNREIELTDEEVQEIVKQNSKPKGVEIKRWDNEEIIFTSTKQTMKEAIEEAVRKGVSLEYAYLYNANLRNASLSNADLYNADLTDANLSNANLYKADLSNANLRYANLSNADLTDAYLFNASLSNADLYNAKFYGRGGVKKLTKEQVPVFLKALGFIIE